MIIMGYKEKPEPQMPVPILTATEEIGRFAADLNREAVIAVDMEADSLHSYREKVCLLQFSTPLGTVLVDPLSGADLSALGPVLGRKAIRKIFHAADYDIRCLHRDFSWEIRGLFDTMIASQLLGEEKVGLADLLNKYIGVELDKQHQRADWSVRPLSGPMIRYAAEDTRHLHSLAGILEEKLKERGRLAWALEEFALLEEVRHGEQQGPLFLRAKGAGTLDRRQLAVLEELLQWRDGEARRRNVPPFKVLGNNALMELARTGPITLKAMAGIEGISPRLADRYGKSLLAAIEKGFLLPEDRLPVYPRSERRVRDPEAERLLATLKEWRRDKAMELEIAPGTLINNALLEDLSRLRPGSEETLAALPGMKNWQARELGEAILGILGG
jgi:ribonuclease D